MAGIYIHIPFCKKKCHYCNFFSVASVKLKQGFISALKQEISLRKEYLAGELVETIYFGGGTPSLMNVRDIRCIIDHIKTVFHVNSHAEISLEANPDDISDEMLHDLQHSGINRLSLGIQSFFDEDLRYLGRIHTARQAEDAINNISTAGFTNFSIDLIYGVPGQTNENWKRNLEKALEYRIPHISAYALTVEEKTPLHHFIEEGRCLAPDENSMISHFDMLRNTLENAGYEHYEISNFCKPGFHSRHNNAYWEGISYLGLGPSAHSFNGKARRWNISTISSYIQGMERGEEKFEEEILSHEQRYNEYVMTSLRTSQGCNSLKIRDGFGDAFYHHFLSGIQKPLSQELVYESDNLFFLTRKGQIYADRIASDLFII